MFFGCRFTKLCNTVTPDRPVLCKLSQYLPKSSVCSSAAFNRWLTVDSSGRCSKHEDNTFIQALMVDKQKNNSKGKISRNKTKPQGERNPLQSHLAKRCLAIECTSYKCYFLSGYDLPNTVDSSFTMRINCAELLTLCYYCSHYLCVFFHRAISATSVRCYYADVTCKLAHES